MRAPPHAYVPGRTPRHPEGLFDAIRRSARPGMGTDALLACEAHRLGRLWHDEGYHWEAHELLEPVWMALPPACAEALALRGAIALANAALKERMGRPRAAARLRAQAASLLAEARARGADPRALPDAGGAGPPAEGDMH